MAELPAEAGNDAGLDLWDLVTPATDGEGETASLLVLGHLDGASCPGLDDGDDHQGLGLLHRQPVLRRDVTGIMDT